MSQWYAVRTATRREALAADGLAEHGFTVFLPLEKRWSLIRRRGKEAVERPLIPGYLFVLCERDDEEEINGHEAVHAVVTCSCEDGRVRPIAFPAKAIIDLQADERAGLFDYTRHTRAAYKPRKGDRVKVVAGTWLNFIGKVLATPRGERAHVMIEGPFGRGVTLENEHIQAV